MSAERLTEIPPEEWARVTQTRDNTIRLVTQDGVTFDEFKASAAVCYAAIGKPAPAVVVAPSPFVALLWTVMLSGQLYDQLRGQLRDQLGGQLSGQLYGQLSDQLSDQLGGQLYGQLGGQLSDQLSDQLRGQLYDQLRGQLSDQLGGQLGGQLYGQLSDQLGDQLGGQLGGQLSDQLSGQLRDQLGGQLSGQLYGQLSDQLYDQLSGQLSDQLYDQLSDQLYDQLYDQLGGQLSDQLRGQLRGQLSDQLRGQLGGQLRGQLSDQLRGQLSDQLRGQLSDQLSGQLRAAWRQATHWGLWRMSWLTHWLHINTIPGITPAPKHLVATIDAYRTFCGPTFTIPLEGVVVGLGPHISVSFDPNQQLHDPTGPAWLWPTGEAIHAWHGTRVPAWVVESPTVEKIAAERNTEIRRCAIESIGWATYLDALNLTPISVEPDPGNPGHELALYDAPDARNLFGADVRLLVMRNASRDRDGSRRTFAETVPATCRTAIDAAAWQFDCDPTIYRTLQRAT